MAIRENKHTVHIEDWVNGIKGSFINWTPGQMPADKNEAGYRMIYYPVGDANKSWMYKFTTIIGKIAYNIFGEEAVNYTGLKVTDTVYPRSAIEGFNGGVTFTNPNNADDVPHRRVVLKEDKHGNAPYAEEFAPGNRKTESKLSELQEENKKLKQALQAQDIELDELQNMKKDDSNDNGTGSKPDYDPMDAEILEDQNMM
jgi:hypothetical protein